MFSLDMDTQSMLNILFMLKHIWVFQIFFNFQVQCLCINMANNNSVVLRENKRKIINEMV